jgi:hypothetical protein
MIDFPASDQGAAARLRSTFTADVGGGCNHGRSWGNWTENLQCSGKFSWLSCFLILFLFPFFFVFLLRSNAEYAGYLIASLLCSYLATPFRTFNVRHMQVGSSSQPYPVWPLGLLNQGRVLCS